MPVTLGGINTGLPANLVEQLIEVEKLPIKNLENRKSKSEDKMKLVVDLEAKLRAIQDSLKELAGVGGFTGIKLLSGDPNIIDGEVDPENAVKGSWNVEVMELAQKSSAISNGFPDRNYSEMGVGYIKFDTPEGTKEVYLGGENGTTLDSVAKKINNSDVGVRATVINDRSEPDAPWKILISGLSSGDDSTVHFPTVYLLDGDQDFFFDGERESHNGKIKIDGFEFEIAENKIKDIIPGVTLDIRQAAPGRTINVSVKEDKEIISGKIKTFIDAMNNVFTFIQTQNTMNEKTDTSRTLGGDSLLRNIETKVREIVQRPQYGASKVIQYMSQIGTEFTRGGNLRFDPDKFKGALNKNPDEIRKYFMGDGFSTGLLPTVRRTITELVDGTFGAIPNRKRGLENKISQDTKRIETLTSHVAKKEEQLRRQFSNLETTMSKMKQQGSMIAARLGGGQDMSGLNLSGASVSNN